MSASATLPYPCGEYPVALLDLPAAVKKELVACRAARDSQQDAAAVKAIERAFSAADAAGCRQSPHFAGVLVEGSECDAKRQLQYCTAALALLQAAPSLSPVLRSVHSRALLSRSDLVMLTGRHTEAIADAQQAAALAVTPWDEVRAHFILVGLYGAMTDARASLLRYDAASKLEAAVAACEAAGVPSTDRVLQDGNETLWKLKYQTARLKDDYVVALPYVRKLRALAKQEGHPHSKDPIRMLGNEAELLVLLGRIGEAMALLEPAARLLKTVTVVSVLQVLHSIPSCVIACVLMGHSALAQSFLLTAEGLVKRWRAVLALSPADANSTFVLQQNDVALARMKAMIAKVDGDAAGAAAYGRSVDDVDRQQQRMCCAEGCTNGFQANGDKLLMCSACKKAWYCSAVCQKADWKARHKAECATATKA